MTRHIWYAVFCLYRVGLRGLSPFDCENWPSEALICLELFTQLAQPNTNKSIHKMSKVAEQNITETK